MILWALLFTQISATHATLQTSHEAALVSMIVKFAPAAKVAGTIDYKKGCAACALVGSTFENKKLAILESKDNNKKIEISEITEDEAEIIFSELAAREDLPFEYAKDGCYSRAHKMVRVLEMNGITAGKAFIEGALYADSKNGEVAWRYQVAPVVMVKKGNLLIPYVFDPSLFSRPVPQTEWKAKIMSKTKSKFTREFYTSRFSYDLDDRLKDLTEYSEDSLNDMEQNNRKLNRILKELKKNNI